MQPFDEGTAPIGLETCPGGDPPRNPEQPAPQRIAPADRAGLAHQDQERCLEGIMSVMAVAQDSRAEAEDHCPVPLHQGRKRRFGRLRVFMIQEAFQELAVGERPGGSQSVEPAELIGQGGDSILCLPWLESFPND